MCPTLDFAIVIEEGLTVYNNMDLGKTEYYCRDTGVWKRQGGEKRIKGEEITDLLCAAFAPIGLKYVESEGGGLKLRPVKLPYRDFLFRNGPWTAPVLAMVQSLKPENSVPLDSTEAARKIRNFLGPYCIDFGTEIPHLDWDSDEAVEAALRAPVRLSSKDDRISRFVNKEFTEYQSPRRVHLARLIQRSCLELSTQDVMSAETKALWDEEVKHHTALRRVFYEAHDDHDDSFFHMRLVFENACGKGQIRMEVSSWYDDGEGSTGKGTCRKLIDESCGIYTGGEQRGYCCVMTHHAIAPDHRGGEKPKEQWANMEGCIFAWVDDFKATSKFPLSNASMRQISGGNGLTAARKGMPERVFDFNGHLILLVNGLWAADEPIMGSDIRRYTGITFPISYKNVLSGPNTRLKDAEFKPSLKNHVPEFWFLARAFWLASTPHATADQTLPRPPSTLALIDMLSKVTAQAMVTDNDVKLFCNTMLKAYVTQVGKPSTCMEIIEAFESWTHAKRDLTLSEGEARSAIKKVLAYKAGFPIPKSGTRARASVNAFVVLVDGEARAVTLKTPVEIATAAKQACLKNHKGKTTVTHQPKH